MLLEDVEGALWTLEMLERARVRVVYDAMHGAGAGVLDAALERLGARVELHRGEPDPRFGGLPPDPTGERLRPLTDSLPKPLVEGDAFDGACDNAQRIVRGDHLHQGRKPITLNGAPE